MATMTTPTKTKPTKTTPTKTTPTKETKKTTTKAEVFSMADLEKEGKEIKISPETLGLGWKINASPGTIEGVDLKKPLTTPLVKKIELVFPTGIEVTARNMKGVTIRDALDAIHKPLKHKADDELDEPYLKGFEWDKETAYQKFIIHFAKQGAPAPSKKAKKAKAED